MDSATSDPQPQQRQQPQNQQRSNYQQPIHQSQQQQQQQQPQRQHHHQLNSGQHDQLSKHQPQNQQTTVANSQVHTQQAHHHTNQHHHGQVPRHSAHMPASPSMPQQHWVNQHPSQAHQSQPQHHPRAQQQPQANQPPQQQNHHHHHHNHNHHNHNHHHQQQNNNQHNQIIKHHPQSQQTPITNPQSHPQQTHHHPNQHNKGPMPMHPMHMPISPSMPQQHWVNQHPSQAHHTPPQHHPHTPQQQHQQTPQQQQPHPNQPQHHPHTPQQQQLNQAQHHQTPGPHLSQPQGPHLLMNHHQHNQYLNPSFIYSQMGHHQFVSPTGHQVPPFDHQIASHQQDPISINSQQQAPHQQAPQPQQAVSINNHHPGNLNLNQLPNNSVMSTATTTGVTSVPQIDSSPMIDPQMANRLPINQPPYHMIASPFHLNHHYNFAVPYMPNISHYPNATMPPPTGPPMAPTIRLPGDPGLAPPIESQGQPTPVPPTGSVVTQPPGKFTVNMSSPAAPITPLPPMKPREKKILAIVDPLTKHVFTVDELKGGSSSTPQSQSSKESRVPEISSKEASVADEDHPSSEDNAVKSSIADSTSGETSASESTPIKQASLLHDSEADIKIEEAMVVTKQDETIENGDSKLSSKEMNDLTESLVSMKVSTEEKWIEESENVEDEAEEEEEEIPQEKNSSNLPYTEGQYSPSNRSGSKRYSINFLKAVAKEMKIELDNTFSSNHRVDFVPHYVKNRDYSMSQPAMRRSSQQALNKPRKVIATHSLQQEVELKTALKPWKPELEEEKTKIIETGHIDTTRLLKVFRGHLNKLTPQKYDSLIEKIAALELDSPERLNSVIDLVFDKAVDEPGFCELYARMCKVIAVKDSTFSFLLVKKCQEEFETADLYTGLNVDERKFEIEQEIDLARKKLLSEELYEDMRLRRKKYLGTIKLIGEMYKLGLLLPTIIGLCMSHLISEATNENIECLCSLITTVGANMANETERAIQDSLKKTIDVLHKIAKTDELALESRIKFKILDTIDLSRRNWRPRMVENNPKKIEEIREEAKKEEMLRQQQRHHHNHSNQSKSLLKNDRDDRDRPPRRTNNFTKKWKKKDPGTCRSDLVTIQEYSEKQLVSKSGYVSLKERITDFNKRSNERELQSRSNVQSIGSLRHMPQYSTLQELFSSRANKFDPYNKNDHQDYGSSLYKRTKIPINRLSKEDWNVKCWEDRLNSHRRHQRQTNQKNGSDEKKGNINRARRPEVFQERIEDVATKLEKVREGVPLDERLYQMVTNKVRETKRSHEWTDLLKSELERGAHNPGQLRLIASKLGNDSSNMDERDSGPARDGSGRSSRLKSPLGRPIGRILDDDSDGNEEDKDRDQVVDGTNKGEQDNEGDAGQQLR